MTFASVKIRVNQNSKKSILCHSLLIHIKLPILKSQFRQPQRNNSPNKIQSNNLSKMPRFRPLYKNLYVAFTQQNWVRLSDTVGHSRTKTSPMTSFFVSLFVVVGLHETPEEESGEQNLCAGNRLFVMVKMDFCRIDLGKASTKK